MSASTLLPVFRLACELVARQRDHKPLISLRCGQQNIRCDKWFHFVPLRISDKPLCLPLNGPPRAAFSVIFMMQLSPALRRVEAARHFSGKRHAWKNGAWLLALAAMLCGIGVCIRGVPWTPLMASTARATPCGKAADFCGGRAAPLEQTVACGALNLALTTNLFNNIRRKLAQAR